MGSGNSNKVSIENYIKSIRNFRSNSRGAISRKLSLDWHRRCVPQQQEPHIRMRRNCMYFPLRIVLLGIVVKLKKHLPVKEYLEILTIIKPATTKCTKEKKSGKEKG